MIDISDRLKNKREELGLKLEEAAADIKVNVQTLDNLEKGNISYFNNDIYNLKNLIKEYAKYLSMDFEKIIDEFNEYIFDFTSKIPVKEINDQINEDKNENVIKSPYTMEEKPSNMLLRLIIILILLVITIIFIFLFLTKNTSNEDLSIIMEGFNDFI